MKRGTFRKQSYAEIASKQREKNERRKVAPRVVKTPAKRTVAPRKTRVTGQRSLAKLKKELDRVFSIHIRSKYPKVCYTCGKQEVTLQCGHFIPRQYLATRWSEDNCRPQCIGCNLFGNGQLLDFEEHLKRELGGDFVEQMKLTRHQIIKLDRNWYENEIKKFSTP